MILVFAVQKLTKMIMIMTMRNIDKIVRLTDLRLSGCGNVDAHGLHPEQVSPAGEAMTSRKPAAVCLKRGLDGRSIKLTLQE